MFGFLRKLSDKLKSNTMATSTTTTTVTEPQTATVPVSGDKTLMESGHTRRDLATVLNYYDEEEVLAHAKKKEEEEKEAKEKGEELSEPKRPKVSVLSSHHLNCLVHL
jgi:hypothetical protein